MEVEFGNRQLERRYQRSAEATRAWGPEVGPRYIRRINQIRALPHVRALFELRAANLHPLTGDRAGQHAVRLTGGVRLILTLLSDNGVRVEEVIDYHG